MKYKQYLSKASSDTNFDIQYTCNFEIRKEVERSSFTCNRLLHDTPSAINAATFVFSPSILQKDKNRRQTKSDRLNLP